MEPETTIEEAPQQSFHIFGRDITQIPCFRNSFLYGISGGIATAFGTFMYTSRPRLGMHVGMGAFTLTTIFYWFNCRYKFSQDKFKFAKLQTAMRQKTLYEGTAIEEAVENSAKSV
ncbi:hypothetical protein HA402_009306 [Bradysia odoriphaga]|nr:hypothetical protein HA402_009306 [Bradysia odoriphaga]